MPATTMSPPTTRREPTLDMWASAIPWMPAANRDTTITKPTARPNAPRSRTPNSRPIDVAAVTIPANSSTQTSAAAGAGSTTSFRRITIWLRTVVVMSALWVAAL